MKTLEPKEVRFVAQINNVKELRLIGVANLDFWNKQLRDKPFRAFAKNGNAEITICATELVWKRFRFNEFTISLAIADDSGQRQSGYFLLHAFNSNRFLPFAKDSFSQRRTFLAKRI